MLIDASRRVDGPLELATPSCGELPTAVESTSEARASIERIWRIIFPLADPLGVSTLLSKTGISLLHPSSSISALVPGKGVGGPDCRASKSRPAKVSFGQAGELLVLGESSAVLVMATVTKGFNSTGMLDVKICESCTRRDISATESLGANSSVGEKPCGKRLADSVGAVDCLGIGMGDVERAASSLFFLRLATRPTPPLMLPTIFEKLGRPRFSSISSASSSRRSGLEPSFSKLGIEPRCLRPFPAGVPGRLKESQHGVRTIFRFDTALARLM